MGDICKMNGRIGFRGYTEKDIVAKEAGGVLTFSPTNIVGNQLIVGLNNTYITKEKYEESPEIKVQNGNILFVKTGSTLGKSALVVGIGEDCTVNPQVVVIKVKPDLQKILSVALTSMPIQKQITAVKIGGAVPTMTETELKNIDLILPQRSDERIKIGQYFKNLDHLITLHQRKCDETKKLKKYMLQKMFPQNGEKVPKIRFAGFSDDWEQRKLDDVVEFLDTMRKPLEGVKRVYGPYPYYGASGIVDYVDGYLFDEELILLSEDGANITDRNYPICFLATGKYWVNNHAHVLRTKQGNENNFICNSLERKDYTQYNTGMAMPKLNKETCKKIPILCPVFEEQKKIGDYFRGLDHLITLHQQKCDELQNIKKFMLKNMFA